MGKKWIDGITIDTGLTNVIANELLASFLEACSEVSLQILPQICQTVQNVNPLWREIGLVFLIDYLHEQVPKHVHMNLAAIFDSGPKGDPFLMKLFNFFVEGEAIKKEAVYHELIVFSYTISNSAPGMKTALMAEKQPFL